MTKKTDLMGLGVPHIVADVLGDTPTLFTAVGAAVGSAAQIPGTQYTTVVNAGTSAVKLPKIGGEGPSGGGQLGSEYRVINLTAATINVFAANNDLGSVVTFFASLISVAGTQGISVVSGRTLILYPVTVSTWAVLGSANTA